MLEKVKAWFNDRLTGSTEHHDLRHLAPIKTLAGQHLTDTRMIVLDLETTGLNVNKDEVIAIGAVAIDRLEIPLDDQFDLILRRPELDIRETVLIHGIGPEALTRGHETEDALIHLLEWINGDPILAFHANFDQRFLEKALKQRLGYNAPYAWLDVAEMLPALFPQARPSSRSLDGWTEHFHLEVSERHHAAADALATAELALICLHYCLKQGVTTLCELEKKLRYQRQLNAMRRG